MAIGPPNQAEASGAGGRLPLWPALLAVTLAAFAMRFYGLADLPPGLHYDEAYDGLDAYALLSLPLSRWPLFFPGNFGREPLMMYLLALAQRLFGPSALTLRGVTAAIGALLTPALAWLAWECAPSLRCERRRLAPWAAAAVLGVLCAQVFARYVIRVELLALVETLCLAALWRGWRTNRPAWWALGGALGGLAFYTYLPARLLPAIFVPPGLLVIWRCRAEARARARGLLLAAFLAAVVAAPLAGYFIRNPFDFTQRIQQVRVLPGEDRKGTLPENAAAVLGMFLGGGDANPRSNVPGRPLLDPVSGVLFLVGLLSLATRLLRPGPLLLLSWLAVMLAPTILSEYAPSFQRAIGALPAIALIVAAGLDALVGRIGERFPGARRRLQAGAWAALAASAAIMWQAFAAWSGDAVLFAARDVGFVELARSIGAEHDGEVVYLSPRGDDHPTVKYELLEVGASPQLRGFDGTTCVRIASETPSSYVVLVNEDPRGLAVLQRYLPDSSPRTLVAGPDGKPWAVQLTRPPGGRLDLAEMLPWGTPLAEGVRLAGYWLGEDPVQPGKRLYIRLYWHATAALRHDYTTFTHLLWVMPDGSEKLAAGFDARPGRGSCATTTWQPGETIVDELELLPPSGLAAAPVYLEVGMYELATGERLAVPGSSGDRILIGPLNVAD